MRFIVTLLGMMAALGTLLVLLTVLDQPLFNASEQAIFWLQSGDSQLLVVAMNLASNLLNPVLCAGYLILLFLVTTRKDEVLRFLTFFCGLSYLLCVMKLVL